jgi:RNA polymerase sigma-70 factor (ECF subfamily)
MPDDPVDRQAFLRQFLQEHAVQLQGIIRAYVLRSGVAYGDAVQAVAHDIFQDAALEALAHADRLDPTTQPRAWFLSIALNMLKRKKASQARLYRREVLISDLFAGAEEVREYDVFEQIARVLEPGPDALVEAQEQEQEILALVSASDARVLRLAVVNGVNTEMLARELGVRPATARVRLHRAIQRLRAAWEVREDMEKRGTYHA